VAKELRIILEDRPGALAELADALAAAKINMDTVAGCRPTARATSGSSS